MSELKPCPFCGSEALTKHTHPFGGYFVSCNWCGAEVGSPGSREDANDAWNRRAQPDNEPLTLEELRGMDGEPVYLVYPDDPGCNRWDILLGIEQDSDGCWDARWTEHEYDAIEELGVYWIPYRRKPEPEGGASSGQDNP